MFTRILEHARLGDPIVVMDVQTHAERRLGARVFYALADAAYALIAQFCFLC